MTRDGVIYYVAQNLKMTRKGAERLLRTGDMTWGQVLVVGALFEMTPKEFCDTFMSGYFVEVATDDYRASVDNTNELLRQLYQSLLPDLSDKIENGEYLVKTSTNKVWQRAMHDNGDWYFVDKDTGDYVHYNGDNEKVVSYKPYEWK